MEADAKLSSLESEVNIVKGEVKALLIDIREIMNNMENPFYNIRSTTDGQDTPPDTRMRGEGAPMKSISPEDVLEQEPHPELAGMPMQQMGAGLAPTVAGQAETPGHAPAFAGMPVQQMGAGPAPNVARQVETPGYAPDFAGMPVQQMDAGLAPTVAGQAETPEPVPDFTEMFRQYEEAKQSGGNGAGQVETSGHAPAFTEMLAQDEIPEPVPDFTEVPVQHEEAKQSEEMFEEIPRIRQDAVFDIHTLAELMRWTDYTLKTIERGKLDELLNLCGLTGHISETLKDTVSKIADLSTQEVAEGSASTMQDHIAAMFQLNVVLDPSESNRKAIYSTYGELPWRKVM